MAVVGPPDKSKMAFKDRMYWTEIELRGFYLSIACDIEYLLADITCACLVNNDDEKEGVRETLFENVMMSKKINMAINALKRYNKNYYTIHKDCFDKFIELNGLRNKFAHSRITGDPEEKDYTIVIFEYIKDGKTVKRQENFHELYGNLLKYREAVKKMLDFVLQLYYERHLVRGGNQIPVVSSNT